MHVFGVSVVESSSSQHDFTLELSEGTFKNAPPSSPNRTSDVRRLEPPYFRTHALLLLGSSS